MPVHLATAMSELSLSFQDELKTTIHNALCVALELAVLEVTRLVRESVRETVRENVTLRQRLREAELQLNNITQEGSACAPNCPQAEEKSHNADGEAQSWCETRQELTGESSLCPQSGDDIGAKDSCRYAGAQVDVGGFSQSCADARPGLDVPADLQNPKLEQVVRVKQENAEPGPVVYAGTQADFGSDSLSEAQSKLLEDWRPEPLHLQHCGDGDPLVPCTSHSLTDPPLYNPEVSELDLQTMASNATAPVEELQRHGMRVRRRGERSLYHCSLCGRNFNRMEHLKIHQRIHTGERPYPCSVCSARFRHSWALTRHFRIHTGEKPYACSLCGKTFRNCGGLRFHQRSHYREGES